MLASTAVILAGGRGDRLRPFTSVLPKPLLPIGGVPILEILIHQLATCGFSRVIISLGFAGEIIETYIQHRIRCWPTIEVSTVREKYPLGTAGPLALVPGLNDPFLVVNADVLTSLDFRQLASYHVEQDCALTVAIHRLGRQLPYGILDVDHKGRLMAYHEKPTVSYMVSMGVYMCDPAVLRHTPGNVHLDFPELVDRLISAGQKALGFVTEGYWFDIGSVDDLGLASECFKRNQELFLPRGFELGRE